MITAQQATKIISQNVLAAYLKDVEREIEKTAQACGSYTQVLIPTHLKTGVMTALKNNGFEVTTQSADSEAIDIKWPQP